MLSNTIPEEAVEEIVPDTAKVELSVAAPVTAKVPDKEAAVVDKDKEESLPNPSVSFFSDPVRGPLSVTLIRLS
jgi:hypothetical protein